MTFTIEVLSRLKTEYQTAKENNQTSFIFDGTELLVDYAKYLIEYLDTRLK